MERGGILERQKCCSPPREIISTMNLDRLDESERKPWDNCYNMNFCNEAEERYAYSHSQYIGENILDGIGISCCERNAYLILVMPFVKIIETRKMEGPMSPVAYKFHIA